jgi:hypothetical protein
LGLRLVKSWAKHLIIPAFLLFAIPSCRGVVIRRLVSTLSLDTNTLLVLFHVYKVVYQNVHIATNLRYIFRYIFVSLR